MTPAAAICSSTTPPGRCCATRTSGRSRKNAATIPTTCRRAMPGSPMPHYKASPPTWRSPCIPAAAISVRTFIASGGYDFVAEQLLGNTNFDGYFLEYDSDRAGGFEPLRFFPKGKKQLVLGLVTSKTGTLENKDHIKRRIDEAIKYVALDQLCLSPQCGFASTEEGNILAEG